jgi:FK506-binding protein 1
MRATYINAMLFLAAGLFFGCTPTDKDGWIKAKDAAFEYKILQKGTGTSAPIEFGDKLLLTYAIFRADSLLERSESGNFLELQMPAREFRNPWENALMLAQVGDSIAVRARMRDVWATMERYEKLFAPNDWVISHFKIGGLILRDSIKRWEDEFFAQTHRFASPTAMQKEQAAVEKEAAGLEKLMQNWLIQSSQGANPNLQTDTILKFSYEVLPPLSGFDLQLADTYPENGDTLIIYYATMLTAGQQIYDNAFARNTRFEFVLHNSPEIIAAFHHATARLAVGQRGLFLMPPALAYGVEGSPPVVPPNSQIVLYLQLVGRISPKR